MAAEEGAAMKRWTLVRLADGGITHAKGETQRTHTEDTHRG